MSQIKPPYLKKNGIEPLMKGTNIILCKKYIPAKPIPPINDKTLHNFCGKTLAIFV